MTKFHNEFFNKGSPRHDKLVLETTDSIKEIYNQSIHPYVINDVLKLTKSKVCYDIFVCNYGKNTDWCLKPAIAFKNQKHLCKRGWDYCQYADHEKLDLVLGKKFSPDFVSENSKDICAEPLPPINKWQLKSTETEKLCKSGNFIIGYEDASFDFKEEVVYNAKISPTWIWEDYQKASIDITIIAECKPDLDSWGGPLRQLKTYIDLEEQKNERVIGDRLVYGLFTTYSQVSTQVRDLLRKESIFVFTFDEDKDNKQSLLFGEGV